MPRPYRLLGLDQAGAAKFTGRCRLERGEDSLRLHRARDHGVYVLSSDIEFDQPPNLEQRIRFGVPVRSPPASPGKSVGFRAPSGGAPVVAESRLAGGVYRPMCCGEGLWSHGHRREAMSRTFRKSGSRRGVRSWWVQRTRREQVREWWGWRVADGVGQHRSAYFVRASDLG